MEDSESTGASHKIRAYSNPPGKKTKQKKKARRPNTERICEQFTFNCCESDGISQFLKTVQNVAVNTEKAQKCVGSAGAPTQADDDEHTHTHTLGFSLLSLVRDVGLKFSAG